jgi:hypothetical protein
VGIQETLLKEKKTYISLFLLSNAVHGEGLVLVENLLAISFRTDDCGSKSISKTSKQQKRKAYSRTRGTRDQFAPTRDPSSQE